MYTHLNFNYTLFNQLHSEETIQQNLIEIKHENSLFYQNLLTRPEILNVLIYRLVKILKNLSNKGICFANLRPENILVKINPKAIKTIDLVPDVKLIDFG